MDKIGEPGSGRLRARKWQFAFERWLEGREAASGKRAAQKDRKALDELLAFAVRPPWRISPGDVQNYIKDLEVKGYSPDTIHIRLRSISRFYRFCQAHWIDPWLHRSGSRVFDPTRGVERPERKRYEKYYCLNREEENAFLEVISQDRSPMGLRDYAMFLCLLRTGWSAERMRTLTYPLPESTGEGKGGIHDALPDEVGWAIFIWLNSSGRLSGIQPGDYIFSPSKDPLHIEAKSNPEDWDASQPISEDVVCSLIERYASKAGLRVEAVNAPTLRHTAVRRMIEAGWSLEQIGRQLGIRAKNHLRPYLKGVATAGNPGFVKKPEYRSEQKTTSHAPNRWAPGNQAGLKHGIYARGLLPEIEAMKASGALEGKSPHEVLILNYQAAIERAFALVDDENIPAGQKPGILEGIVNIIFRITKLKMAAHQMEQMRRAEAEGREYKPPEAYLGHKPSRSYRRSAYNPDNAYPKLSEREKQRRYDEAHGRLTFKRSKPSSRRREGSKISSSTTRRTYRRPAPYEEPTYHVDFFNEGGEEEE